MSDSFYNYGEFLLAKTPTPKIDISEPLILRKDVKTGDHFVVYSNEAGITFELRFDGEEPWATQNQMADLFGVTQQNIAYHIGKILGSGELEDEASVHKEILYTAKDGKNYKTKIYSLDMILEVGHRVNSKNGIMFRRWSRQIERQYLLKGFVIDENRLENPDERPDYFNELMDAIRSIRASGKRMWTRVNELASFCSDYEMLNKKDIQHFYATLQNTMHYAVHGHTAADLIYDRLDASKPNAGVIHFKGRLPKVTEAASAKNLLGETEINALNLLTSVVLEFFESQVEQQRPTTLDQFSQKLRDIVKLDGRPLIPENFLGNHSAADAKRKASAEIATFKELERIKKEDEGEESVSELLFQARSIAKEKSKKRSQAAKKHKK